MAATFFPSSSSRNSLKFHSFPSISSSLNPRQNSSKSFKFPNPEISLSPLSTSQPTAPIKMPTAPWMRSPIVLQPHEIINTSKPKSKKNFEKTDKALTGKESGVRGKKAMKKIVEMIEKLQEDQTLNDTQQKDQLFSDSQKKDTQQTLNDTQQKDQLFSDSQKKDLSLNDTLKKQQTLNDTHEKVLGKFEFRGLFEKNGHDDADVRGGFGRKVPWVKEERFVFRRMKKEKVVTKADMNLDRELLERLREEARKMRKWVKVMKAGVTEDVVSEIRLAWRRNELAMVKFHVPLCRNMDRAREILELKTGGLVVWTRKDVHVIYRGKNYQLASKSSVKMHPYFAGSQEEYLSEPSHLNLENKVNNSEIRSTISTVDEKMRVKEGDDNRLPTGIFIDKSFASQPIDRSLYEKEADRLLDGLGPRFIDWWMWKPLPVDADLLPEVVAGFKPPFRLCPPNARPKLTDDELTYLRKFAHPLPTHFVLGRNRRLQGLATAILKLWEKSLIAKIAIKLGVPNTNNEQMAEELKRLTGGVLLLRNKFLIILYRGKDFLPDGLTNLIVKREMELKQCQLHEEGARLKAIETVILADEPLESTGKSGTLSEFQDIQSEFGDMEGNREFEIQLEADIEKLKRELRKQERKLSILNIKIKKSEKELAKLNSAWRPSELEPDQEMISEEERSCLHKIGLKMSSKLLLGRRGVFDGVIEGVHQHWKHREVVKVISMQKLFIQVVFTARLLVAETGGILVSIDKLKEGHAIIIYRGKNYRRPMKLMTENLLTKRKALQRSLEMQRLGSLKFFAYHRQREVSNLKLKLAQLLESRENNLDFPC